MAHLWFLYIRMLGRALQLKTKIYCLVSLLSIVSKIIGIFQKNLNNIDPFKKCGFFIFIMVSGLLIQLLIF